MTKKPDGGPAYPQMRVWNAAIAEYEDTQQYPGMTLRDYFAGQALAGAMSTVGNVLAIEFNDMVKDCYDAADAMIAERNK